MHDVSHTYHAPSLFARSAIRVTLALAIVAAVATPLCFVVSVRIETLDAVVVSIRHIDLARV